MKTRKSERDQGYTFIELLMVVGVIAVMGGIAIVVIGQNKGSVEGVKLRHDVASLNEAVHVYLANGGSMDGIGTLDAALEKLKTVAAEESAASLVGLRGAMLDQRTEAVMMDASETTGAEPRVLWSVGEQRFVIAISGSGGAKSFVLNGDVLRKDALDEARETALSYSKQTTWVWDYADSSVSSPGGVAGYSTSSTGPLAYSPPEPPAPATRLAPPSLSLESGLYNYFDFDLEVELTNPNPASISAIYYTLGDLHWYRYNGVSVTIAANQSLTAHVVSLDGARYSDSDIAVGRYESSFTISGTAGGEFLNPEGSDEMVTNLLDGQSDGFFSFGTAVGTPDPSWLLFNGASFADVGADVSFLLGTLDYYNGTIRTGTQAESVGLSIDLTFDGGGRELAFSYDLELISTPNSQGNTAEESADFVRLGNLHSDVPVQLGGVSYDLILEFGETTEGGFSSVDQFHVIEGQSASGNLYGRLVEVATEEG